MNRIGLHVSAAGGADNAPDNAVATGCETFQFFSRSPRGGPAPVLSEERVAAFHEKCRRAKLTSAIHAPYYINFASANNRISFGSTAVIREELQRGSLLGVKYLMTHLGSRKDLGQEGAIKQAVERIGAIFEKGDRFSTMLLLEISAGASDVLGDTFDELAAILNGVGRDDIGICLDTCHLFASGYDVRTPEAITETMQTFKKHIPLSRFKLLHVNDSKFGFKEHKDRHADIGDGELGKETFRHLLHHPAFKGRDFILETPGEDDRRARDVALLKKLRTSA